MVVGGATQIIADARKAVEIFILPADWCMVSPSCFSSGVLLRDTRLE
jgi:hypothetical protein